MNNIYLKKTPVTIILSPPLYNKLVFRTFVSLTTGFSSSSN